MLLKAGLLQDAIINSANFSSIATDENGVIQLFNVGAERMLGYKAAEVVNKITPADISDPQELVARQFAATVSVTALRDTKDIIIGYLLIGTDNTARKQAESAHELIEAADTALLEAKRLGRNRVVVAPDGAPENASPPQVNRAAPNPIR